MRSHDARDTVARLLPGAGEASGNADAGIARMLQHYLGEEPFGGRDREIAALDAWRRAPDAPARAILTAPAGRGKSALLAQWAARLAGREDTGIVYYAFSVRYGTNRGSAAVAAIAAGLARLHGEALPGSASAREQAALVSDLLGRPLGGGRILVVILDGLDEAVGWDQRVSWAPAAAGVRILVSARSRAGDVLDESWSARLGWRADSPMVHLSLGGLDREAVAALVDGLSEHLTTAGTLAPIAARIHALAEGDPLLTGLYVKALSPHGDAPAVLRAADLADLRPGLDAMLAASFDRWLDEQRQLWGEDAAATEGPLRALIGLCATALGPLTTEDAIQIGAPETGLPDDLVRAARRIGRLVVGDGEAQGFTFGHPRLREYFLHRLGEPERDAWRARFVAHGRRAVEGLRSGAIAPGCASRYVVQYHAAHLTDARAPLGDFAALLSEGWLRAWEWIDGTPAGFLDDARVVGERAREEGAAGLGAAILAALTAGSMRSLADGVPDYLLIPCVEAGLVSPRLALVMVRQKSNAETQARCLSALCPHLPAAERAGVLAEALCAARSLEDPVARIVWLRVVIPALPPEERLGVLDEMVTTLSAIEDESRRSMPIGAIAEHLPPDAAPLRGRLLGAARAIEDPLARADALETVLTEVLSTEEKTPELVAELLAALRLSVEQHRWDCHASPRILETVVEISAALAPALLDEAVDLGCGLVDEAARTAALKMITRHLPPGGSALRQKVLRAARQIQAPEERLTALTAMTQALPAEERAALLAEAAATARTIEEADARATGLLTLAGLSPEEQREPILREALAAGRLAEDDADRAHVVRDMLSAESPPCGLDLLAELIELALGIAEGRTRAFALMGAAERVSADRRPALLDAALAGVRAMPSPLDVAYGLMSIADALAPAERATVLSEALVTARAVEPPSFRAEVFLDLARQAEHHPGTADLPSRILAEELGDFEGGCVGSWVYSELVPHLPPEDRPQALTRALAIDRRIRDHAERARTLCALAGHLPAEEARGLLDRAVCALRQSPTGDLSTIGAVAEQAPPGAADLHAQLLELARRGTSATSRAEALLAVSAPRPPAERLALATEALDALEGTPELDQCLGTIAEGLPGELLARALSMGRAIADPSARAWTMGTLALHLPEPSRIGVLTEALQANAAVETTPGTMSFKLTQLLYLSIDRLPCLPPEDRPAARAALSQRARATESSYDRPRALLRVARCLSLPEEREEQRALLTDTLALAREEKVPWRGRALGEVAAALPPGATDLLAEVLAVARAIDDAVVRVEATSLIAEAIFGTFPAEALTLAGEALVESRLIPASPAADAVTLAVAQRALPSWQQISFQHGLSEVEELHRVLASCTTLPRGALLSFLEHAAPLLARLGGPDLVRAAVCAVCDVTSWWP